MSGPGDDKISGSGNFLNLPLFRRNDYSKSALTLTGGVTTALGTSSMFHSRVFTENYTGTYVNPDNYRYDDETGEKYYPINFLQRGGNFTGETSHDRSANIAIMPNIQLDWKAVRGDNFSLSLQGSANFKIAESTVKQSKQEEFFDTNLKTPSNVAGDLGPLTTRMNMGYHNSRGDLKEKTFTPNPLSSFYVGAQPSYTLNHGFKAPETTFFANIGGVYNNNNFSPLFGIGGSYHNNKSDFTLSVNFNPLKTPVTTPQQTLNGYADGLNAAKTIFDKQATQDRITYGENRAPGPSPKIPMHNALSNQQHKDAFSTLDPTDRSSILNGVLNLSYTRNIFTDPKKGISVDGSIAANIPLNNVTTSQNYATQQGAPVGYDDKLRYTTIKNGDAGMFSGAAKSSNFNFTLSVNGLLSPNTRCR